MVPGPRLRVYYLIARSLLAIRFSLTMDQLKPIPLKKLFAELFLEKATPYNAFNTSMFKSCSIDEKYVEMLLMQTSTAFERKADGLRRKAIRMFKGYRRSELKSRGKAKKTGRRTEFSTWTAGKDQIRRDKRGQKAVEKNGKIGEKTKKSKKKEKIEKTAIFSTRI